MKRGIIIVLTLAVLLGTAVTANFVWMQGPDSHTQPGTKVAAAPTFYDAGPFKIRAEVEPEAPRVGKNHITVIVQDKTGNPVTGVALNVVAVMPAMGSMPAMYAPAEMVEAGTGRYEGEFEPSMSGEWPLAIEIKSDGIGAGGITFDMAIGRKGLRCATCGSAASTVVPGTVQIDAHRRQIIGVTSRDARFKRFRYTVRAAGRVAYDETRISDVTLKFDAWIGELKANFLGAKVIKGQPLFTIYSPKLLSAQEEYLEALRRHRKSGLKDDPMLEASRRRLLLWDIAPEQIQALEQTGRASDYMTILAPAGGVVIEKQVFEGSAVRAGQRLLRVADLSRVWVEAQVYEYELPLMKTGMDAEASLPELQDRVFKGKVSYVFPFMDGDTHTARIRVELDNADGFLRPDMYTEVKLRAKLGKRLVVPEEAVLYAGDQRVVFIDLGDGRLQPRKIKTGLRNRRWIEVLEGLQEGDTVVTSANFLIAAESKLKSGLGQW
ncbi:MAG: efflux RND transporter periplasmic adaptor subunit [Mariprofundaceae bacterium]